MAAGFKPVLGRLALGTAGFSLTGDNAGFCDTILNKRLGGQSARLESLTYVLPVQSQEGDGQEGRSPVVVNLLMQLRASCDQNNVFLRTGQASQAQIMAQLRQTLARSDRAVRAQAGEIERAVRHSLFQEDQFRQALARLEREVKKNGSRPRQAVPLTDHSGSRMAARRGPGAALGAINSILPFRGGADIQVLPGRAGLTVEPPLSRMTAYVGTQSGQVGQTATLVGQRSLRHSSQPRAFGTSKQQTAGRRSEVPVHGAALYEEIARERGAVPLEAAVLERGVVSPARLRPQKAGTPDAEKETGKAAEPITVAQPDHYRSTAADGLEADRTPAPARDGGGRPTEASAEMRMETVFPGTARAERQPSDSYGARLRNAAREGPNGGSRQEYSLLSMPYLLGIAGRTGLFPVVQAKWFPVSLRASTDWRAGKAFPVSFIWNHGTGAVGQIAGKKAPMSGLTLEWRRLASGLGQGNAPEAGITPGRIRLTGGSPAQRAAAPSGTAGQASPAIQGRIVRNSNREAASGEPLEFEQTADQSRTPLFQETSQRSRFARRTISGGIRAIAARYMGQDGTQAVFPMRIGVVRPFAQTQPERKSRFAVRRGLQTRQPNVFPALTAARFPGVVDVPNQGSPSQLTPAPAKNVVPTASSRFVPVPAGTMTPPFLKRLNPALPAHSQARPVKRPALDVRMAGQTIYRTEQGRQALTDFPQEGATVRAAQAELNQETARHQVPRQWLARLGPTGVERHTAVRSMTALKVLPGADEGIFLRWLSPIQAAAGTIPAGRGRNTPEGRISGPAEGFNSSGRNSPGSTVPAKLYRTLDRGTPQRASFGQGNRRGFQPMNHPAAVVEWSGAWPQGQLMPTAAPWKQRGANSLTSVRSALRMTRNTHFDSGTALTTIFRTPDGYTSPESKSGPKDRRRFPSVFRTAVLSGQREALTQEQPAAAAAWKLWTMEYLSRVQSAPRVLHSAYTQNGERLFHLQRTHPGAVEEISRPGNSLLRLGMIQERMRLPRTGTEAFLTGNGPFQMWAGTSQAGNALFPKGTLHGRSRLLRAAAETARIENGPRPMEMGTFQPGNILRRAGVGVIRTGHGWFQTGTAAQAGEALAGTEGRSALPGLAHFAQPLEPVEKALSNVPPGETGGGSLGDGSPYMIFRSPAPPEAQTAPAPEQEGESVLAAQTIAPERTQAMNRAFSYGPPAFAGSAEPPEVLAEQRNQTTGFTARDINYNRLTEEILVRIERRLRAERRKFGL